MRGEEGEAMTGLSPVWLSDCLPASWLSNVSVSPQYHSSEQSLVIITTGEAGQAPA